MTELQKRRVSQTARIDARIAKLKVEAAKKKRREETARLLGLGRAVDGLVHATGDDLARLVLYGRWVERQIERSGWTREQLLQHLDPEIRRPRNREIVGLPPLPEPAAEAVTEPEPPQAPREKT